MDLFVINRYKESVDDTDQIDQEESNLRKLKQRIDERKKINLSQKKTYNEIILKESIANEAHIETILSNSIKHPKENEQNININEKLTIDTQLNGDLRHNKPNAEFKVLGTNEFEKKVKVKRVLPHWLSNPFSVSTSLQNLSCNVDVQTWLHPIFKATLHNEGITHLFPVQEKVIPFILEQHVIPAPLRPSDICVSAPTGSGKTLSFVLPILQTLMNDSSHHVRALIVLPVQELAIQVAKVFRKYCTGTGLKVALLSGLVPLRQEQRQLVRLTESHLYISEVDIIVCTAGRLVEHMRNTEGFSLKYLKFLVIDEADRIMDHIQNDWLYHLDRHIKLENELLTGKLPTLNWNNLIIQKAPHKLLFSATLSQDPEKLEQWGLFQPKLFSASSEKSRFENEDDITKYTTPDELTEQCIISEPEEKPLILYHLLTDRKWNRVLCFTNSSQSAHRLTVLLNHIGNGLFQVAELSAALDRSTREKVLKNFHQSKINVLVSTDALARGIDISECDYVVSYDPPRNIKTYIHRVGRTGRAGRRGTAITMLLYNQVNLFKNILQSGGKNELSQLNVTKDILNRYSEIYNNAMQLTKNYIREEINSKVKKSIILKRGFKSKTNNVHSKKKKFSPKK